MTLQAIWLHDDMKYRQWHAHTAKYRTALNLPDGYCPWTKQEGIQLWGIPGRLERAACVLYCIAAECLQDAAEQALKKKRAGEAYSYNKKQLLSELVVDISQNIGWANGTLHCLQRNATIYVFAEDVVLPGRLHALVSGYPRGMDFSTRRSINRKDARKAAVRTEQTMKADRVAKEFI